MTTNRILFYFCLLSAVLITGFGCVSGGKITSTLESPAILVSYVQLNPNIRIYLIRTKSSLAILERSEESGTPDTIIEHGWDDKKGHHFVIWGDVLGALTPAFEYTVPYDLEQPALRQVYSSGSYTILEIDGVRRPVPFKKPVFPGIQLRPSVK